MAFIHTKGNGHVSISDDDGDMVDLSPYTNNINLYHGYDDGLWNYSLDVKGLWDPEVDALLVNWLGPPRRFRLQVAPLAFSGTLQLMTYGVGAPVDAVVTWSAEFIVHELVNDPVPAQNLSFAQLRETNVTRCLADYKHGLSEWSALEWAGAMCGEAGETANLAKKLRRGEDVPLEDIADEIADTVIYADLLAASLGITLGDAVVAKFNKTSRKIGSSEFLTDG